MISLSSTTRAKTKLVLSSANRLKASAKLAPQPGAVAARVVVPPAEPPKTKPEAASKAEPAPRAGTAAASRAYQPQLSVSAIGAMLIERFPQCFVLARDRKRPLKTGIHFDLITALPEVPPKRLTAALGWYAGSWAYLRNLTAGAARIDLNGQPAGEVTSQEATAAAERLASEKAAYFAAKKTATERK